MKKSKYINVFIYLLITILLSKHLTLLMNTVPGLFLMRPVLLHSKFCINAAT